MFLTQDDGDRKVVPQISKDALYKMAAILPEPSTNLRDTIELMTAHQPASMGHPTEESQSGYYPGSEKIIEEEIEAVKKLMEAKKIAPENTRLRKNSHEGVFEIMQASVETDNEPRFIGRIVLGDQPPFRVILCRGDHSEEMTKICAELTQALELATTEEQRVALSQLTESFRTGNYDAFRAAHKT